MPKPCCETLHPAENSFSGMRSLCVIAMLKKVQHAGLFLWTKSPVRMKDFHLCPRVHFPPSNAAQCQPADIISRRNELVQDRDAGSVWAALACSFLLVGQPCRR